MHKEDFVGTLGFVQKEDFIRKIGPVLDEDFVGDKTSIPSLDLEAVWAKKSLTILSYIGPAIKFQGLVVIWAAKN